MCTQTHVKGNIYKCASIAEDIEEETQNREGSQNEKVPSVLDVLHTQKLSVLSEVLTNRSRSSKCRRIMKQNMSIIRCFDRNNNKEILKRNILKNTSIIYSLK